MKSSARIKVVAASGLAARDGHLPIESLRRDTAYSLYTLESNSGQPATVSMRHELHREPLHVRRWDRDMAAQIISSVAIESGQILERSTGQRVPLAAVDHAFVIPMLKYSPSLR